MPSIRQRFSHLLVCAMLLVTCTSISLAAEQTVPAVYDAKVWPQLTALAQQAQQQGAVPTDENGKPITELKTLIKRYQGRYAAPTGIFKVFEHQGQLRIKREGDLSKLLRLQKDGQFAPWRLMRGHIPVQYNETKKVRYAFMTLDGRDVLVVHEHGTVRWAGEKTNTVVSNAWAKRTGKYQVTDLQQDAAIKPEVMIRKEFDLLWVIGTLASGEKIIAPLVAVEENEYRLGGVGHWAGELLSVAVEHGQEVLKLGAYVLQRK